MNPELTIYAVLPQHESDALRDEIEVTDKKDVVIVNSTIPSSS